MRETGQLHAAAPFSRFGGSLLGVLVRDPVPV
jgi:hypothetical protein